MTSVWIAGETPKFPCRIIFHVSFWHKLEFSFSEKAKAKGDPDVGFKTQPEPALLSVQHIGGNAAALYNKQKGFLAKLSPSWDLSD